MNNWSGYYIGTVEKQNKNEPGKLQDTEELVTALMSLFLGSSFTVDNSAKIESSETTNPTGLTVTYDFVQTNEDGSVDNLAGTWATTQNTNWDGLIDVYTVKSSTQFAMYYVLPADDTGVWTTVHTLSGGDNIPGISHFTGFLGTGTPPPGDPPPPPPPQRNHSRTRNYDAFGFWPDYSSGHMT